MRVLAAAVLMSMSLVDVALAAPPGSYQGTCTNAVVQSLLGGSGKNLQARCQRRDGSYHNTNLALPCSGDIQNKNGNLVCVAGDNPFAPPPGSYKHSCSNISMAGPILRATCAAPGGSPAETTLNVLNCHGDISVNGKGRLTC